MAGDDQFSEAERQQNNPDARAALLRSRSPIPLRRRGGLEASGPSKEEGGLIDVAPLHRSSLTSTELSRRGVHYRYLSAKESKVKQWRSIWYTFPSLVVQNASGSLPLQAA